MNSTIGTLSSLYEYSLNGLVTRHHDESGNVTEFGYDGSNCLMSVERSGHGRLSIGYDENNNIGSIDIHAAGADRAAGSSGSIQYAYDELDRARDVRIDGRDLTIAYNALRSPMTASSEVGKVRYLQDDLGRPIGVVADAQDGVQVTTEIAYDDLDRVTSSNSNGRVKRYGYDVAGRLESIEADSSKPPVRIEYDRRGNVGAIRFEDGAVLRQRFGDDGQVIERTIESGDASDSNPTVNPLGSIEKGIDEIAIGVGILATVVLGVLALPEALGLAVTVTVVGLIGGSGSLSSGWYIGKGIWDVLHSGDDEEIDFSGSPPSGRFIGVGEGGGIRIIYSGRGDGITEKRSGPLIIFGDSSTSATNKQGSGESDNSRPNSGGELVGGTVWGYTGENKPTTGGSSTDAKRPETQDQSKDPGPVYGPPNEFDGPPPETGHVDWKDDLPRYPEGDPRNTGNTPNPMSDEPDNLRHFPPGIKGPINAAMPVPDGDGPMGPLLTLLMPTPDGGGPMGPLSVVFMPTPDGGGPMGPASLNANGAI